MNRLSMTARILTFLYVLMVIFACAGVTHQTDSSQAALTARATEFWRLRIAGQHAETYPFESPDFRKRASLTIYVLAYGGSGSLLDAKVDSVSVAGDQGTATVTLRYLMVGGFTPAEGITRTIGDRWQRIDGQWYHLPNPPADEKKKPPPPHDYNKERKLLGLPVPPQRPLPKAD